MMTSLRCRSRPIPNLTDLQGARQVTRDWCDAAAVLLIALCISVHAAPKEDAIQEVRKLNEQAGSHAACGARTRPIWQLIKLLRASLNSAERVLVAPDGMLNLLLTGGPVYTAGTPIDATRQSLLKPMDVPASWLPCIVASLSVGIPYRDLSFSWSGVDPRYRMLARYLVVPVLATQVIE
jgi:hypothetical protein